MDIEMPTYFAKRPEMKLDEGVVAEFEKLYSEAVEDGKGGEIEYTGMSAPRWKFLCWLCETQEVVLHGSGNGEIGEFEPLQPADEGEFSGQKAVFAASDGIWPMYFAIVNRNADGKGPVKSLVNACFRVVLDKESGEVSEPYYYLSINEDAFEAAGGAWRKGWIYVLPKGSFVQNPPGDYGEYELVIEQWASPVAVKPLAKIRVGPEDFPLLGDVYGHDMAALMEKARSNPGGFPWID